MISIHGMKRLVRGAVVAAAVALVATGCDLDSLLDVDPVDQVPAEGLTVPGNADLLVNGAVADFECAFGAYVALSGVTSGELMDASPTASRWPAERRDFSNTAYQDQYATFGCTGLGIYEPLSKARWSADNILAALQGWTDAEVAEAGYDRQTLIARSAAYAGYSYLLLAEGFCSMAIDQSAEMQPTEVFDSAVARFTTAIDAAQSANQTDLAFLSRVGRARAYLNLGQGANAVADAQQIPEGFVYDAETAPDFSVRENRIFAQNGPPPLGGSGLSVGEEYWDFQHMGQADPRVPVTDFIRMSGDGTTPIYFQLKYESLGDPLPLATYDEAQLIIAEVEQGQAAVDIINAFHLEAGLPPFSSTDDAEILAHVLEERRAELWLEGHRLNDIDRHGLPLVPAPGTAYRKGLAYGSATCYPLPEIEIRNNPNI